MTTRKSWSRKCVFCLLVPLLLAALAGCSQVRLVHNSPEGGVVSIPNNSNQWPTYYRNRAEYLMKKKCPDGYVIEQEQVVEDNPAARDGRKPNEDFEYDGAYERISHYRREEYRITFHKAVSKAPAPAAPPAALPPDPAASPAAPTGKDEQELPPPRPLSAPRGEG